MFQRSISLQVGLEIGAVSAEGLRGALAARDFEEGEIVAAVPYNCTIDLASQEAGDTAAVRLHTPKYQWTPPCNQDLTGPYWSCSIL